MTAPLRLACGGMLFLALTALRPGTDLPLGANRWGPTGNGMLDHADDLRWVRLHGATITADGARGRYQARFGPTVAKLDGAALEIAGYMLPVEANVRAAHFVLTRRSAGCPFCPPNEPTEAIEVFAAAPFAYTQAPVTVTGRLRLVSRSDTGLFYRLDHAKVQ